MSFKIKRSLLNPKFDGYKLAPISEADCVRTAELPEALSQATVSAKSYLFFQEVQSRVRHNHLAASRDQDASGVTATFMYIDRVGVFTSAIIDLTTQQAQFHSLFEIPAAIQPSQDVSLGSEYPVAVSLGGNLWILSDGSGRLYVIETAAPAISARQLSHSEIVSNNTILPCRLHAAIVHQGAVVLLVSSRGDFARGKKVTPTYDLMALRVPITSNQSDSQEASQAETLWRKSGTDIPSYADIRADNWMVCSGSVYKENIASVQIPNKPSSRIHDGNIAESQPSSKAPPPYTWTQTSDSLTVSFPLPSDTAKSHINVRIGPKHVSLLVKEAEDSPFPLPRYAMKELWDQVDQSASTWTWDKEGEKTVGLLTLHLEKRHEGTKWSHVFAREGVNDEEAEVPETVDPSEMIKIVEAMEKYTSELKSSGSGPELGTEIPSLATGEMDPSVDAEVGRQTTVSYYDLLTGDELAPNTAYQEILALPLPLYASLGDEGGDRSLTVKNGIDGPLFEGPVVPTAEVWEHVSTFPALAFVLASKRDTRFVYHVGRLAVIALENGGREAGPNMYIYHDAKGGSRAKQGVVRLGGDGTRGALLGVGGVQWEGKVTLVCLREKELVLVHDFL